MRRCWSYLATRVSETFCTLEMQNTAFLSDLMTACCFYSNSVSSSSGLYLKTAFFHAAAGFEVGADAFA